MIIINVFDIIGPVMIGPSSSHTAGAVRIGRIARKLLGKSPVSAHILLHGSFAKTYKGHGTDKAIIAGILDMYTDDPRIRNSFEVAKEQGMSYEFETGEIKDAHPNTARITLTAADNTTVQLVGCSIGGGNILVKEINNIDVSFSGQYATMIVLHKDAPGTIASVTEIFGNEGINICNFTMSRKKKGGLSIMTIEFDGVVKPDITEKIKNLPHIYSCTLLETVT